MTDSLSERDAEYAIGIVRRICEEVGPGTPGSPQERRRAASIRQELALHLGDGNVTIEEFTVSPGAFLGTQRLSGILLLVAALLNAATGRLTGVSPWLTALPALVLSLTATVIYFVEFIFSRELTDPFFRKAKSCNVIGTLCAPGGQDAARVLIMSGHHDSALENRWLRYLGYGFLVYSAVWFVALLAVPAAAAIQVAGLVAGLEGFTRFGTLGRPALVFLVVPAFIYALFFNMGTKGGGTVPGAVDNLAASALLAALCRFLVNNPALIPSGTEIRFISFGGEEAGLRGSRNYVERHRQELRRLDARVLNFEMIACPEIAILTSDANGTISHSPDMVGEVVAAAGRAGVPYKLKAASLGIGTDAAPFSRAGIKATALLPFQIPQQLVAFYHQKWDGPDALTVEPLLNVLRLALEWVRCAGGEPFPTGTVGKQEEIAI